jgi:hypothetical protein
VSSIAQVNNPTAQHPHAVRARQEPCWQQVGLSKDVIDQRDAIQRDTHSQVESVCADSSLTPQQKKQKIHEIRQDAKQKVAGLITADQQQQLQACQKERAGNHPAPVGMQHGGGPCGGLPGSGGDSHSPGTSTEESH